MGGKSTRDFYIPYSDNIKIRINLMITALRKIVRSQSKMVQRPYSENYSHELLWKTSNTSLSSSSHKNLDLDLSNPGAIQPKPPVHIRQRPKITTIIASVDKSRSKSGYHHKVMKNEIDITTQNELRLSSNVLKNITAAIQANLLGRQHRIPGYPFANYSYTSNHGIENPYETSTRSSFFPSLDEQNMQNLEAKLSHPKDNAIIIIPDHPKISKDNSSSVIKGIYISDARSSEKPSLTPSYPRDEFDLDNDKVDYFLKEITSNVAPVVNSVLSTNDYSCTSVRQAKTDIDAQEKFAQFDIEVRKLWDSRNVKFRF